jgi:hypothetical protein
VLPLGSPSFSILLLKEKDLVDAVGSATMWDNVAPHAWSPPTFPHTETEAKVMYAPWQGTLNEMATRFQPKLRNRIASRVWRKERLPSKHEARFHPFYLFLWLFNPFNNLGSLLSAQS